MPIATSDLTPNQPRDVIFSDARIQASAQTGREILATFGEVTEDNDRVATIELRPGMFEGEYLALAVRRWGMGHWCRFDGQPACCTDRADAVALCRLWISEGKER